MEWLIGDRQRPRGTRERGRVEGDTYLITRDDLDVAAKVAGLDEAEFLAAFVAAKSQTDVRGRSGDRGQCGDYLSGSSRVVAERQKAVVLSSDRHQVPAPR